MSDLEDEFHATPFTGEFVVIPCRRLAAQMRAKKKWLGPAAPKPQPTHCAAGHALTADNVWLSTGGRRRCRRCKRAYDSVRHAKRSAVRP